MRIIAGIYKGKNIIAPKNLPVRPTTDFAKESLFNILINRVDFSNTNLLELFAGTGNIGYEFASRGCTNITSVDVNFQCVQFMKQMNRELKLNNRIIRTDAIRFLKQIKEPYSFIFADPPYQMEGITSIPNIIFKKNLLTKGGTLIIEHDKKLDFSDHSNFQEKRNYGRVNFSFFVA
jgi:16S rRNA (guanine(966)-N(2))-methyltransferase RsmD